MFAKFQFRFLINALVAVGIMAGYSYQMMGPLSGHHHASCAHSHADHEHHNDDDGSSDQPEDCTCLMCGFSFISHIAAQVAFRTPTFSLSEIPARLFSQNSPPFASGIDRPPRG